MLKEQQKIFNVVFSISDFFVLVAAFYLAVWIRFELRLDFGLGNYAPDYDENAYTLLAVLFSLFQVVTFSLIGAYNLRRNDELTGTIRSVFKGLVINSLFLLTVVFFIRLTSYSRLTVIYFFMISLVAVTVSHRLIRGLVYRILAQRYNPIKMVIAGNKEVGQRFLKTLSRQMNVEYSFVGFVSETAENKDLPVNSGEPGHNDVFPVIGSLETLPEVIKKNGVQVVVVALNFSETGKLLKIKEACDRFGTQIKLLVDFPEFLPYQFRIDNFSGIPVITLHDVPLSRLTNRAIKKLFNLAFSATVLVLTSPLLIFIAILIKLTSKGPVLFRQERVGINNRQFTMYKFRTMSEQDQQTSDTAWTAEQDPRVTPVGGFLRRFSLDELPQFVNVLIGNMSVVGPRPERPYFVEKFRHEYVQYMKRHQFKSGITGLAQISGLRGDSSIEKRVRADVRYLESWSFWLDIRIILLTLAKVWRDKNAY